MKQDKRIVSSLSLVLIAWATPAFADDAAFGADGQVILSAERLFGITHTNLSQEDGASHDKQTDSTTNIGLLWPAPPYLSLPAPYASPHAAIDFVVGSGVTVGGSIGFVSQSGTRTTEPQGGAKTERDTPSMTLFAIQPRVGYALPLGDTFAFWPRAGITYYSIHVESTNNGPPTVTSKTTLSGLAIDLEAMFVFTPIQHFGITLTPLVDIPVSGSSSTERDPATTPNPPDDTVKFTTFGATVGVLGYI